jgi:hypothetical protein
MDLCLAKENCRGKLSARRLSPKITPEHDRRTITKNAASNSPEIGIEMKNIFPPNQRNSRDVFPVVELDMEFS